MLEQITLVLRLSLDSHFHVRKANLDDFLCVLCAFMCELTKIAKRSFDKLSSYIGIPLQ